MIANTPQAWSERAQHGSSWEAAMWSRTGQHNRFLSVLGALDPQPGETLLDYGCGTGALAEYVPTGVQYVGYDWSVGMLARAETEHPYHQFTKFEPQSAFDTIACVGPFNLTDNWTADKTWAKLASLWGHTRRALTACLYSGNDARCLSYGESEALVFGSSLGIATVTRHLPNDLLLVVRR